MSESAKDRADEKVRKWKESQEKERQRQARLHEMRGDLRDIGLRYPEEFIEILLGMLESSTMEVLHGAVAHDTRLDGGYPSQADYEREQVERLRGFFHGQFPEREGA